MAKHEPKDAEDPGLADLLAKRDAAIEEMNANAEAFFAEEQKRTKAQAAMAKKSHPNRGE